MKVAIEDQQEELLILFDKSRMRPASISLAGAYGCDMLAAKKFPKRLHLVEATDEMRRYRVNRIQLDRLIEKTIAHHKKRGE